MSVCRDIPRAGHAKYTVYT